MNIKVPAASRILKALKVVTSNYEKSLFIIENHITTLI